MARYNAWQNRSHWEAARGLPAEALDQDRGAFFGSIRRTLNHVLWGDMLWMSRFDNGEGPGGEPGGMERHPTLAAWWAERFRVDARIQLWADEVSALDLTGELIWYSGLYKQEMHRPMGLCVAHFFNHQTHHRGQVHAMLTAAGAKPEPTDLAFMEEV